MSRRTRCCPEPGHRGHGRPAEARQAQLNWPRDPLIQSLSRVGCMARPCATAEAARLKGGAAAVRAVAMQRALGGDGTPALPDESAERLLAQARCPLLGTRHVCPRAREASGAERTKSARGGALLPTRCEVDIVLCVWYGRYKYGTVTPALLGSQCAHIFDIQNAGRRPTTAHGLDRTRSAQHAPSTPRSDPLRPARADLIP